MATASNDVSAGVDPCPTSPVGEPMDVEDETIASPTLSPIELMYSEMSVGLDLGSLHSRVSQIHPKDQMPTIVRNNLANEQTPSVISFRQRQERFYGDDALPHLTSQPQCTAHHLKQLAGAQLTEDFVAAQSLHFAINSAANAMRLELEDGQRAVAPTHLVAMLLKQLLRFARQQKNAPAAAIPAAVVVAVPSYFSDTQAGAIRDALLIAGVPPERAHVIPEPVAELICFHHSHYSELHMSNPMTVVLVDVGHEQSFVTLAQVTKTKIEVLATEAAPVGSSVVDKGFVRDAVQHVLTTKKVDLSKVPKALARLEKESRKAKEMLSMLDYTDMTVESLTDEVDLHMKVQRDTLTQYAAPLADTLAELSEKVMAKVGPEVVGSISRLEILGGGLRMPCLQEKLKTVWGRALQTTMDGSLSLTQGCAIYGLLQSPTEETTRILQSLVSKADEVRRIMDTLHRVEISPAPALQGISMSAEEMQRCLETEADLQARDNRLIAASTARNAIESYVYGTRGALSTPEMQKALGDDCSKVQELLNKAEEWLWDSADDTTAEAFTAKLEEVKQQITGGFPALTKELERQAEEQAKRDAMLAEEARKAAAETKKEPRSDGERIKFAEERKEQGNQLLKNEHHQESITRYVQALAYLGEIYAGDDPEMKEKKDAIALSCHLNIANASNKIGLYQKAIDNCDKALQIQPTSAKAYFRKGQALSLKSEFLEAKKCLEKALELAPGDKLIEKEIKANAKKMDQHKAKEKKMYANMFGAS